MYCEVCSQFFQPPPEEEKILTTGGLPILCNDCERKRWIDKEYPEGRQPVQPGTEHIGDGRELYRVVRYDRNGLEIAFLALPQKPLKPRASALRKPRKHDVHVFVMSERTLHQRTAPPVRLLTNIKAFRERWEHWQGSEQGMGGGEVPTDTPLTILKVPQYWDPYTGIGEIRIPPSEIVDITDNGVNTDHPRTTRISLQNGDNVVFYYR